MHVTYGEKSLLMGDDVAGVLIEYAAALGASGGADSVTVQAVNRDGNAVAASFLLNGGVSLMAETATSDLPAPDDAGALADLRARLHLLTGDRQVLPEDPADLAARPVLEAQDEGHAPDGPDAPGVPDPSDPPALGGDHGTIADKVLAEPSEHDEGASERS